MPHVSHVCANQEKSFLFQRTFISVEEKAFLCYRKYKIFRAIPSYLELLCLATSASSHLSLGPQDVGHKGVVTRCCAISLTDPHAETSFRIGSSGSGDELDGAFCFS